jgi:Lrp/AsnC family transcriptional regulator, leucine-responsive regulatory protein
MVLQDSEKKLLDLLKINSRTSAAELGRKLGLARSTIHMMLTRLEEKVIDGYTIKLKTEALDNDARCYVTITRDPKKTVQIEQALYNMSEVDCLATVAGSIDFMILVRTDNNQQMDSVLTNIAMLDGVINTESHIILSSKFNRIP